MTGTRLRLLRWWAGEQRARRRGQAAIGSVSRKGPRGIRANAVAPGPIRTELGGGLTPDFEAMLAGQTALARVGEPDEVARVIASLVGDDLAWVNGQCIEVSGGYCI